MDTPAVYIFATNSVGRPLSVGTVSKTSPLAPGTTWDFELSIKAPVPKTAVFVDDASRF